ncbi:hypothetical protein PTKIN_Ptkin05aG0185000 [Pterospermum kingtungense]
MSHDHHHVISLDKIPTSPKYPWWKISTLCLPCIEGDPAMGFVRDGFPANIESWGAVVNTFSELETPHLDHLKKVMGHDRVWAVGPLHPFHEPIQRGGSSSVAVDRLLTWLDTCEDGEVFVFLTHCGWNSVLEAAVAGVTMLKWPFAADQFVNETLLVDELGVAQRACEGAQSVPNSDELARVVAESVCNKNRVGRETVEKLRNAALKAIREGGSSAKDMEELEKHLFSIELAANPHI